MSLTNTQTKIAAALLLVLLTALTTTAIMSYLIYDRTLSGLVASRFEYFAKELKRKIEAGLDLGLPLGELDNINELLRQELLTDRALVALSVINARGVVLFDTDSAHVGRSGASDWLRPETPQTTGVVPVSETELGIPLFTSYGKLAGGLLVEFSKKHYDEKRSTTLRRVAEFAAVVLLMAGIVGVFGVLVITRPLDYAMIRLDAGLRAIAARVGVSPGSLPESEIDAQVAGLERTVLAAVVGLERAEDALDRDGRAPSAG